MESIIKRVDWKQYFLKQGVNDRWKELNMKKEYKQIETLYQVTNEIIDAAFSQDYDTLNRSIKDIFMPSYQSFLQEIMMDQTEAWGEIQQERERLLQTTSLLLEAQEHQDYLLLADYLELSLQPVLGVLMDIVRGTVDLIEETDFRQDNDSFFPKYPRPEKLKGYQIELTQQGPLTVRVNNEAGSFYFHSNINPWSAAEKWVQTYGEDTAEEYAVLGLGLGYHVLALWKRTQGAVPVHVYEPDASILALAERYQDFHLYRGRNLHIHYDPDLNMLMKKLSDHRVTFAIHHPSLRNIRNVAHKEALEKFFISDSSRRRQTRYLYANFRSNTKSDAQNVDVLGRVFAGKDVFIVAAGPSLDKNIELLRERSDKSIILATGTVFQKLMRLGIRPDYVMITDANERIVWQIFNHYRKAEVPLIILSSAYYRLCAEYEGDKYLIYQKDFAPAEEYAAKQGRILFETGGSVSTAALDVCIRLQAGRIIFLGLDLAFTDNLAHASGTSNRLAADQTTLQQVKSCDGGMVLSDYKFNIYAEWIENRLRQEDAKQIPVINATEGGRYIEGMEYRTLKNFLEETG